MQTTEFLPASEAKQHFGRLLDTAQREPVTIQKQGRPVAVMMSHHDYQELRRRLADYENERETQEIIASGLGAKLLRVKQYSDEHPESLIHFTEWPPSEEAMQAATEHAAKHA